MNEADRIWVIFRKWKDGKNVGEMQDDFGDFISKVKQELSLEIKQEVLDGLSGFVTNLGSEIWEGHRDGIGALNLIEEEITRQLKSLEPTTPTKDCSWRYVEAVSGPPMAVYGCGHCENVTKKPKFCPECGGKIVEAKPEPPKEE